MEEVTHTPTIGDDLSAARMTFGAKAKGFLDSICCLFPNTMSLNSGLLRQPLQLHEPMQYTPAAKHSQYLYVNKLVIK